MEQIEYTYRSQSEGSAHSYLVPELCRLLANVASGSRCLDLGCGNGSMIRALQSSLGSRLKWTGVDGSSSGVTIARQYSPDVQFFVADLSDCQPLAGCAEQFDVVLSTEVIEHVLLPRRMVDKIKNSVKVNGIVIISTPYHGYLKNLALALTGRLDKHFTVLWDYGHIKFWSRETLEEVFREKGFEPIHFCGVGRFPWLWKSMIIVFRRKSL